MIRRRRRSSVRSDHTYATLSRSAGQSLEKRHGNDVKTQEHIGFFAETLRRDSVSVFGGTTASPIEDAEVKNTPRVSERRYRPIHEPLIAEIIGMTA